jgi:hypothetical protein
MACNCACSEANNSAKLDCSRSICCAFSWTYTPNWSLYCCWIFGRGVVRPGSQRYRAAQPDSLPTLRQRAFFLGLVLPGYPTLVVWRLNPQCALWHLYNITKSDVFPRQYSVTQYPADVLRLSLSHNLAGELSLPAQLSTQIVAFNATAPTLFFSPFRGYNRERI